MVLGELLMKDMKWFIALWVTYSLLSVSAVVAVVVIAVHFIRKFW